MKKKILFLMPSMFIGGAERSLIGLLEALDYERYDVSIFLYRHEGEFLSLIPKQVHLLPAITKYATFDVPIKSLLQSRLWVYGVARIAGKIRLRLKRGRYHDLGIWAAMQFTSRSLLPFLPTIPGQYDLGISFLGIPDVLLKKVNAKVKVAWNHTDYSTLGPDKDYDRELYNALDYIVSVSDPCTEQFLKIYPELSNKAITVENILSKTFVDQQANEDVVEFQNNDTIKLLSVGRYSYAKNFDSIPDICRRIIEKGINITWYLIGYGGDETLIRQRIVEAGMEDRVIILGKRENPYPYIKKCDLYVQPSRFEGKCVTVREAQMLGKPVVITRYATASHQLEDGVDGVIVPMDNEKCATEISSLLQNQEKMEHLSTNCSQRDYTNSQEVKIIYHLLHKLGTLAGREYA